MAFKKVNSLAKGLMILESFNRGSSRLFLAELARMTNTPKATTYRILKTLTELNYLKYDAVHKKYSLGLKVLSLGFSALQTLEMREMIRPYLANLTKQFNKTVSFVVLDGKEMVYVERIRASDIVNLNVVVGTRIPLYNTAAGKVVLAHMEERKLADTLEKIKSDPGASPFIDDRSRYLQILQTIRKNGYSTSDEEYMKGIRAIAVPVFGSEGIIGAINLVVAGNLVSIHEMKKTYAPLMIQASLEISEAFGYMGGKKQTNS